MPSWRRVFTSDEARIEGLAGASPLESDWPGAQFTSMSREQWDEARDWPFSGDAPTTPPDDEALVVPELSIAERAERLRRMGATPAMLAWYTQTRPQDLESDDEGRAESC